MKNRLLLAFLAASALARAASFEETFNATGLQVELRNGAALGGPGSGVSGKYDDLAYTAVPPGPGQDKDGPVALARAPIAPAPLSAFTCAFWYYLDEKGPGLQVPLNIASVLFLMNEKGLEIRIENSNAQPRAHVFTPGLQGPCVGWRDHGQWIFAAFTWEQKNNTLSVYQATRQTPLAFMRDMHGPVPANPTLPRLDLDRRPETIGNTSRNLDRPLAGKLDNVRFYDRLLTQAELSAIRSADLANEPVRDVP